MRPPNYYAAPGFERAGLRRREPDWIRARVLDPASLFVPVWRSQNLVIEAEGGEPRAAVLSVEAVGAALGGLAEHEIEERLSHGHFVFLGLIDERAWKFLWITDFPMFVWSEEEGRWNAEHHPFTRPTPESEALIESDPGQATAIAYDLIANGQEIGGGSLRIHEPDLQAKVFEVLQLSPEEQRMKFGFLLDALSMGAPPHGGIAFGIDRMVMVLARESNLRDTVAFPKNQAGVDPMTGAPTEVAPEQLEELGLRVVAPPAAPD